MNVVNRFETLKKDNIKGRMMKTKFKIDTYAVMGNPVAHSKSPIIHTEFAKQTNQLMQYIAIEAPLTEFAKSVADFQEQDGKGLNVTVPFKIQAWQLVNERSHRAEIAGAVNTISIKENGQLFGDNTDGAGLVRDLMKNENFSLTNKKILILGAGGAVQGILGPLLDEHPQFIFIANRTVEKAMDLAKQFRKFGIIHGGGFNELNDQSFDLIINGTSAGLSDEMLPVSSSILSATTFCYDLAYGKETVFLQWAKQHGVLKCNDGLGMLVEQAAEAFHIWRGVSPKTQPVLQMLRSSTT